MARRFIVEDKDIETVNDNIFIITGKEVKHIQVLRLNIGEEVKINNAIYKIREMKKESIVVEFINEAPQIGVPLLDVTLYIAMLKNDKMDYVVQKAVEIGAKRIVPFFSSNVIVRLDEKIKVKRKEKLQIIANEACKQCGRTDYVEVCDFISFKELKNNICAHDRVLFAYESSKDSLRLQLESIKDKKYNNIACIIGAEGGFTHLEAEELKECDKVSIVSLGSRILRAETAALNLLSIIIYELEE